MATSAENIRTGMGIQVLVHYRSTGVLKLSRVSALRRVLQKLSIFTPECFTMYRASLVSARPPTTVCGSLPLQAAKAKGPS